MIDRRTFIQQGTVVATIAGGACRLTAAGASTADYDRRAPLKLHVAIFDRRFAAGRRFARTLTAQGVATHAIQGDVTSIWFDELHPLWKRQPAAIAGLTTYGPLFCLERLAWDHGMRVLLRDQHDTRAAGEPDQMLYSWVIAPRRSA